MEKNKLGDFDKFLSQMYVRFEVSTFRFCRDLVKCDYISVVLKAFSLAVFQYNLIPSLRSFYFPKVCNEKRL